MPEISLEQLVLRGVIAFFAWLTALVFLAVQGAFGSTSLLLTTIIVGVLYFLSWLWPRHRWKISRHDAVAVVIILAICIFIGFFHHDLALGRDPVSYFTAGLKISETGILSFTDELARPFHGLTALGNESYTSQFLPGYTVYLAVAYLWGGIGLLGWANIPLLFLSLTAIYLIGRRLSSHHGGLAAAILTGTSYAVIWFARRWTSEDLMMLAIWGGIACFIVGVRRRHLGWLLAGLTPIAFSLTVRGEGLLYLGAYILVLLITLVWWRRQFKFKSLVWFWLAAPIAIYSIFQLYVSRYGGDYVFEQGQSIFSAISGVFDKPMVVAGGIILLIVILVLYTLRTVARYRWKSKFNFWKLYWALGGLVFLAGQIIFYWYVHTQIPEIKWDFYRSQFVFEIFNQYLLAIFFAVVFLGFYKRIYQRLTYLLILVAAPSAVFILDPYIALDHPWFMRRFVAVFVPLVMLLAAIALARFRISKKAFVVSLVIIVVINLAVAGPILWHQEKAGAAEQLADLASRFDENDLVLMRPGWQWQQWAYYLHFLYGVDVLPSLEGFEEGSDLTEVMAVCKNIYILSDNDYAHHPLFLDSQLELVEEINLKYPELEKPLWGLAAIFEETDGQVDVYDVHRQQQALPPDEIVDQEINLQLFKVK